MIFSTSRISDVWIPYQAEILSVDFEDVGGYDDIKEELRYIIRLLKPKHTDFAEVYDCRLPRGILLVGPPGTGKTHFARAIAGEAGVPLFVISASEFIEIFVGVGAHRVRSLFASARKHMPSIIFIDEIDSIGRIRGGTTVFDASERDQTLDALLTELDGFHSLGDVLVIAATNRFEVLDTALRRPGRFDYVFRLRYPDHSTREKVFHALLRKVSCDNSITPDFIATVADTCSGASQADLDFIVRRALQLAILRDARNLASADMEKAAEEWNRSNHKVESLDTFLLESRTTLGNAAIRPRTRVTLFSGEMVEGYAQWQDSQYLKILTLERPHGIILQQSAVASLKFVQDWEHSFD